jgi:hypothetical protein
VGNIQWFSEKYTPNYSKTKKRQNTNTEDKNNEQNQDKEKHKIADTIGNTGAVHDIRNDTCGDGGGNTGKSQMYTA